MESHIDWLGCATFRLKIAGLTLFLDTYMNRVPSAPKVGLSAENVTEADFILIGHSHFDHIAGAEIIALNTGATVIGSTETANVLKDAGIDSKNIRIAQGGERYRLNDSVSVKVFPSLHSCIWIPKTFDAGTSEPQTGNLYVPEDERWCCRPPAGFPDGTDPQLIADIKEHRENTLGSNQIGGA